MTPEGFLVFLSWIVDAVKTPVGASLTLLIIGGLIFVISFTLKSPQRPDPLDANPDHPLHPLFENKYRKAKKKADEGDAMACFDVAEMYFNGKDGALFSRSDTVKYVDEGLGYLSDQARNGNAYANLKMGEIYHDGSKLSLRLKGLVPVSHALNKPSPKKSRDYFTTALVLYEPLAVVGDLHGLVYTAYLYRNAFGCARNLEKAAGYLEVAAVQGDVDSMKALSEIHMIGLKKPDLVKAAQFMRMAAASGDAEAQFKVGESYHRNRGEVANLENAYFWYSNAARQGWDAAAAARLDIEIRIPPEELLRIQERIKGWTIS